MAKAHLKLDDFLFIGRTFEEYLQIFSLHDSDLFGRRILDCPAGACSFAAHASRRGAEVVAADVLYTLSPAVLEAKGRDDIEKVRVGMGEATDNYLWGIIPNVESLVTARSTALSDFVADYETAGNARYVAGTLPQLPFSDGKFDLVLSAHYLFTYAEKMSLDDHLRTIQELIRVSSREIRLFPLVSNDGHIHPYLDETQSLLRQYGCQVEVLPSRYKFQKGANEVLRILIP